MNNEEKIITINTLSTFKSLMNDEIDKKILDLFATDKEKEEFIQKLDDYILSEEDKATTQLLGVNAQINKRITQLQDQFQDQLQNQSKKLQDQLNNALFYLSDKKVGDVIKIKEGSTLADFVIVHKGKPSSAYDNSCDGIWVMRKSYSAYKAWNRENVSCDYKDCLINTYLNGDYYNSLEQRVKDCIFTVKIPHYTNGSVKTGTNGFETKVFLLSHSEMGLTYDDTAVVPIIGSPLEFYSGNYKDNFFSSPYYSGIRSIKKVDNETFFGYAYTPGNYLYFNTSHTESNYVTPVFILSPGAFVKGDGTFIGSISSPAT